LKLRDLLFHLLELFFQLGLSEDRVGFGRKKRKDSKKTED
jgi:hypothetical protein